jgi:dTMP kinase
MSYPGFFLVLDGPNGSGKSTQVKRLSAHFTNLGYTVVTTREPGGSPQAEQIRDILVNGDVGRWDAVSEILLFAAARRNHVETVIKPALAAGSIVISDRFVPSTIAYQGYGNQGSLELIEQTTKLAIGDFKPDFTMLMFVDIEEGLKRAHARRNGSEQRFTSYDKDYHQRVYDGFTACYDQYVKDPTTSVKMLKIESTTSVETVTEMLIEMIIPAVATKFYMKYHVLM